jgi:hypothetical protein
MIHRALRQRPFEDKRLVKITDSCAQQTVERTQILAL